MDGPRLDVATTVRRAVPVLAGEREAGVRVENGRVVGIVDREAVLLSIAGERDD